MEYCLYRSTVTVHCSSWRRNSLLT